MNQFLLRMVINGFALYAAVYLIDGINLANPEPLTFIILALIFGILNALVKPILKLATCPIILLTLGMFTLVINTALFYLTGWVGAFVGIDLTFADFWAAFLGALIVTVVSVIFNTVLRDELKGRSRHRPPQRRKP